MPGILEKLLRAVCRVALLAVAPQVSAAEPLPLENYGSLPDIERMALSYSGNRVAAVMKVGGERVVILLTSELKPLRMMKLDEAKVRSLEWVGDDHVVVEMSRTQALGPEYISSQYEFWHAFIIPVDETQPERMVFDNDPSIFNAVFGNYGVRQVDGRWVLHFGGVEREKGARNNYAYGGRTALFAVNLDKDQRQTIGEKASQGQGAAWLLGSGGNLAATMSLDGRTGSWSVKVPGGPVLAHGFSKQGDVRLVSLGKDGTSAIYSELNENDHLTRWFEVPLDGSAAPSEFARAEEISRAYSDRTTGQLLGLLRMGPDQKPQFYAPQQQAAVNKIYGAFPKLDVGLIDWTPDFSRVLVRTSGNGDSGTWYLVDLKKMSAKALGYERDAVGPEHVGAISTVAYKAGDGLDLDGILTLPPGREPKNLPLVMLPHGGPHAYDDEVFDWWAQAFASRGYAVFQPNFRGSTNRDEAFMRAGFGQWGRAMQTDISDGIAELARQGIVDPKRACIVGASYGGYAALAGVTLQQGLYRCAVAVAPVSDLGSLFSTEYNERGRSGMLRRSLLEELGPRDGFDAVSPRRFAAQADAPILLIHGKDDTVVPFDQSTGMADALKDAGKPYRLVVLREEDHWLSRADTRLQMLTEALAFVEQNNPAD